MAVSRIKYPRTPHLSFSPGVSSDDLLLDSSEIFTGAEVVVTEKLDGENTTIYQDYIHARSIDSKHHPSRAWVKSLQAQIGCDIPPGWRICGENLYARHSIAYENLGSYFYVFSIWDEDNTCLSWQETEEWASILELAIVPVLYRGTWNEAVIKQIADSLDLKKVEGYVVRKTARFQFSEFGQSIAKWVRKNHVQTDEHWMYREIVPNKLRP